MLQNNNETAIWKKWFYTILSSVISVFIGITIGYWLNGLIKVEPKIDTLNDKLKEHCDKTEIALKHIVYETNKGTLCKVGINPTLDDHIVSITAKEAKGFEQGETIFIIYYKPGAWKAIRCDIEIVDEDNKSEAKFFINEKMCEELGFDKEVAKKKGTLNMYFKRESNTNSESNETKFK